MFELPQHNQSDNKGLYIRIKKYSVFNSINLEYETESLLFQVSKIIYTFDIWMTPLCKQTVSIMNT